MNPATAACPGTQAAIRRPGSHESSHVTVRVKVQLEAVTQPEALRVSESLSKDSDFQFKSSSGGWSPFGGPAAVATRARPLNFELLMNPNKIFGTSS